MRNIFVIMFSLFLISCSEENDNSNNKNEQSNDKVEVIQQAKIKKITENKDEDLSDHNISSKDKWDKIVDPQEGIVATENQENIEASLSQTSPEIPANDINEKDEPYKPSFAVSKNDIILGNASADVVVIEYFSPTCPHCFYYHEKILPELKKQYIDTNKIAYVIREFIGNKQDLDAAILERCQNNVDSFIKFQTVILAQQNKWAVTNKYRELLTNIGQIGGISAETYEKCLADNKIFETLLANTKLASSVQGFVGTPTFFVNGLHITEGYSLENLSKQIDKALQDSITNNIK